MYSQLTTENEDIMDYENRPKLVGACTGLAENYERCSMQINFAWFADMLVHMRFFSMAITVAFILVYFPWTNVCDRHLA